MRQFVKRNMRGVSSVLANTVIKERLAGEVGTLRGRAGRGTPRLQSGEGARFPHLRTPKGSLMNHYSATPVLHTGVKPLGSSSIKNPLHLLDEAPFSPDGHGGRSG